MPRTRKPPVGARFDPLDDPQIRMMVDFFALKPILGDLSVYSPVQRDLLRRSLAYRSFIRSGVENPGEGAVHPLDLMWERSGKPADKTPREWLARSDLGLADESIEDRGEAGVFGDREAAGWYAHHLDPEGFDLGEVVDHLY